MPPAKTRVTQDDSRSDASNSKNATVANHTSARGKRNGVHGQQNHTSSLKDVVAADDTAVGATQTTGSGMSWQSEDLSLLQHYRAAHKLDSPSAFKSPLNQFLLTSPGIAQQSPTMARRKAQRKVNKDHLALAVRKNFNAAAVNEIDVMVDLLYKIRNQDKAFRMRSLPGKNK